MKYLLLVLTLVMSVSAAYAGDRLVTTTATGEIKSIPDLAIVSGQVMVEASTAREATRLAQSKMDKVTRYILKQQVETKDLNAASVQVHPKWHYPKNKPRELDGYQAVASFALTLRNLEQLGELYSGLPGVGATHLNQTRFEFSDRERLELMAIEKATQNAKSRAKAAVNALGNTLGDVKTIQVNTRWNAQPVARLSGMMAESSRAAPKMNVGDHALSATVTVSFLIK